MDQLLMCRMEWMRRFYAADPTAADLGTKIVEAWPNHPGPINMKMRDVKAVVSANSAADLADQYLDRQLAYERDGDEFPTETNLSTAVARTLKSAGVSDDPPARPAPTEADVQAALARLRERRAAIASAVPEAPATPATPPEADIAAEARAEAKRWQNQQLSARGFTVNVDASEPSPATGEDAISKARAEGEEYQRRQLRARGLTATA